MVFWVVHLATVSCWYLHTGVKVNSLEIGDPEHAGDLDAMKSDLDAGVLDEMEAQNVEHRNSNYFGRLSKSDINAGALDEMEAQNVTIEHRNSNYFGDITVMENPVAATRKEQLWKSSRSKRKEGPPSQEGPQSPRKLKQYVPESPTRSQSPRKIKQLRVFDLLPLINSAELNSFTSSHCYSPRCTDEHAK